MDARTRAASRCSSAPGPEALIALALEDGAKPTSYAAFEKQLTADVFALASAVMVLFLVASEARVRAGLTERVVRDGRIFRVAPAESRNLLTYLREVVRGERIGHPNRGNGHGTRVARGRRWTSARPERAPNEVFPGVERGVGCVRRSSAARTVGVAVSR